MNAFDYALISFLNQWTQRWPDFDRLVVIASNSDLLKGGIIMAAIWGAWFRRENERQNRRYLLSAICGALVALFVARILAATLPLRLRPLLNPAIDFRPPSGLPDQSNWTTWSSFPSDHAALFFALATGIFFVSKRWGAAAFAYVAFVICLPRIYVGIHYPSDIIAGVLLAFGAVILLATPRLNAIWTRPLLSFVDLHPVAFYAIFFLLTFQIATLFWDIRMLLNYFGFSS